MITPQDPPPPPPADGTPILEAIGALGWVDLTALAVLLVFLVLGLFRGMVWQLSRIATLVLAYLAAGVFGTDLAAVAGSWFPADAAPELPLYAAYVTIFLCVLIVVGVLTHVIQRWIDSSPFSFANRVGGGLLGLATGALIVLAGLTAAHMTEQTLGVGGGLVAAARESHSLTVGQRVVRVVDRVLPDDWRGLSLEWRALLGDPELAEPAGAEDDR